ncbi:hypothetical protein [Photorhabdus antumapuensis]|uniref:hypothetical protein n=1 Tax=Photorhabdus antumapuensis TaxID=2862867 RepID=UPI001CECC52C|nr:hypothetical protein [Photorhabdus antumapuensis]MCA6222225.1 hypothetical protein [Photorhabdus antumapuensis]
MKKPNIIIICCLSLLLIFLFGRNNIISKKEEQNCSYDRNIQNMKLCIRNDQISDTDFLDKSDNRFGMADDNANYLSTGMSLPTDFIYENKAWKIATIKNIFEVNKDKSIHKYDFSGVGLIDSIPDEKNRKFKTVIADSRMIQFVDDEILKSNSRLTGDLVLKNSLKYNNYEITNCGKNKCIIINNDGIPQLYSIPDIKLIKSYNNMKGYDIENLSIYKDMTFFIARNNKDNSWSLYKEKNNIINHISHLRNYANGLLAIDENRVIAGNRNDLILYNDKNGIKEVMNNFTHIMRIKEINGDICILDSDDPLLICLNKEELIDTSISSPSFKVIAGNILSYSSIVSIADGKKNRTFISTRPGAIYEKDWKTGKQENRKTGKNMWKWI